MAEKDTSIASDAEQQVLDAFEQWYTQFTSNMSIDWNLDPWAREKQIATHAFAAGYLEGIRSVYQQTAPLPNAWICTCGETRLSIPWVLSQRIHHVSCSNCDDKMPIFELMTNVKRPMPKEK